MAAMVRPDELASQMSQRGAGGQESGQERETMAGAAVRATWGAAARKDAQCAGPLWDGFRKVRARVSPRLTTHEQPPV